jgi:hypothetical protein
VGTREFDEISTSMKSIFTRCTHDDADKHVNYTNTVSSRGNYAVHVGFSHSFSTKRDQHFLHGPQILRNAQEFAPQMVTLSHLLKEYWICNPSLFRSKFAIQLHEDNLLEGFTYAKTLMGKFDKYHTHFDTSSQMQIKCHCDVGNCTSQENNFLIIASVITISNNNSVFRTSAIGYARKSLSDYQHSTDQLAPLINEINLAVTSERKCSMSSKNNFHIVNDKVKFLKMPTKYMRILLKLKKTYLLSIERWTELMYPLTNVKFKPYYKQMCKEVKHWIKSLLLPEVQHYGIYLLQCCDVPGYLYDTKADCDDKCELIKYVLVTCYEKRETTKKVDIIKIHEHAIGHLVTTFGMSTSRTILTMISGFCYNDFMVDGTIYCRYSPICIGLADAISIENQHVKKFVTAISRKYKFNMMDTEKIVYDVLLSSKKTRRKLIKSIQKHQHSRYTTSFFKKNKLQRTKFYEEWAIQKRKRFSSYLIL